MLSACARIRLGCLLSALAHHTCIDLPGNDAHARQGHDQRHNDPQGEARVHLQGSDLGQIHFALSLQDAGQK